MQIRSLSSVFLKLVMVLTMVVLEIAIGKIPYEMRRCLSILNCVDFLSYIKKKKKDKKQLTKMPNNN